MTAGTTTTGLSKALNEHFLFKDAKHVVDIGGGYGALTVEILRANPHLTATTFDMV
jgi:16S rRNA G1207 methylase RsmC